MRIKLKDLATVGAGQKASLSTTELDNYCVHALHLQLGGATLTGAGGKAKLTNLYIKLAGKPILNNMSGTERQSINTENKLPDNATELSIYFGNPEMKNYHDVHAGDWDLSVIKGANGKAASLDLQFTLDATAGADAALSVEAEVYPSKSAMGGVFRADELHFGKAFIYTQLTPAAALNRQDQDIDMASHAGALVLSEYWFHANLTSLEVRRGTQILWEDIPVAVANNALDNTGHTAVAGMYVWQPVAEGYILNAEPTIVGNNQINHHHLATTSAGDTINVHVETLVDPTRL